MVGDGRGPQAGVMNDTTPDDPHSDPPPPPVPVRLRRAVADKKVAGVAAGLARHFDVDVTLVRLGFVALTLFGGSGLVLYAVAWLIMPVDDRPAVAVPDPTG